MSALGGNHAQDLIDAIRSLSREFSAAGTAARGNQASLSGLMPGNVGALVGGTVGGPIGAMAGEALGNNIFVNAALKTGREFAGDVFNSMAGDYAKYGSGGGFSASDSFRQGVLNAAENVPFFGDVAAEVTGVQRSAKARLKGLTVPAARGGAVFTAEELRPAAEFFQAEEGRATQNSKAIDALFKDAKLVDQAEATSPRFQELQATINELNEWFKSLSAGASALNSILDGLFGRGAR